MNTGSFDFSSLSKNDDAPSRTFDFSALSLNSPSSPASGGSHGGLDNSAPSYPRFSSPPASGGSSNGFDFSQRASSPLPTPHTLPSYSQSPQSPNLLSLDEPVSQSASQAPQSSAPPVYEEAPSYSAPPRKQESSTAVPEELLQMVRVKCTLMEATWHLTSFFV